ncbi:hypothetical protein [Microbaculum marinisediminis]|uniref:Uncharacterized protein n=1 Tax=Microbaculum marinisediminis TaxID=2931392 RepID=A0AAW5R0H3_9HYPH|nr:hypothetical protein [Microbaculum sp. A6E488]MCT8972368.1 hypothetical protein [Microbaculum sp. A6E488]
MAVLHAVITLIFWALWVPLVYLVSSWLVARWPWSGDVLGVIGTLMLFFPTASGLAWDVISRTGRPPLDHTGNPVPPIQGYAGFSWVRICINAIGISLIGVGFFVNYLARS